MILVFTYLSVWGYTIVVKVLSESCYNRTNRFSDDILYGGLSDEEKLQLIN